MDCGTTAWGILLHLQSLFCQGRILMYVINNIHQKQVDKKVDIVPLTYRIDFGKDAIDRVVTEELEKDV